MESTITDRNGINIAESKVLYKKAKKVIDSCVTLVQLEVAVKYVKLAMRSSTDVRIILLGYSLEDALERINNNNKERDFNDTCECKAPECESCMVGTTT